MNARLVRVMTILALQGASLARAAEPSPQHDQGSRQPNIISGVNGQPPHEFLFWRLGSQLAVRRGNWKLVTAGNDPAQLFDLAADLGEKTNLAGQRPDVMSELAAALQNWNEQLAEPRWPAP